MQKHEQSLIGLPADLNDYPVLSLITKHVDEDLWGINFELDSQGKGIADTLLHVGDPKLFPDMLDSHIDFHSVEFVPKGRVYSAMRKVGLGGDEKWRYTPQNVVVAGITNGVVNASFEPGSDLVLTKSFDSLDLQKSPWVYFEYTLPEQGVWSVQVNAKVDVGGISRDVLLLAQPLNGKGKQRYLVNYVDLLQKVRPHAKDGKLKDLVIHIILDPSSVAVKDVHIDLGHLDFYSERQLTKGNTSNTLLIVTNFSNSVDLVEKMGQMGHAGEFNILKGSLKAASKGDSIHLSVLPEINIKANHREKTPKLFVGEGFYLDDLTSGELSDVLDQKLFLEKNILWEMDKSDGIFLDQNQLEASKSKSVTLRKYFPEVQVGDNSYVQVNYEIGGGALLPVYLTLTGSDRKGKSVSFDYLISNNTPIKIDELKLKSITLSYKRYDFLTSMPSSFKVNKIQISRAIKSKVFHNRKASTIFSFDGGNPTVESKVIWKAEPEHINFDLVGKDEMLIVKKFAIDQKISPNTVIRFDLEPTGSESWFVKFKSEKNGFVTEQSLPIGRHGSVVLPEIALQEMDLVVKGGVDAGKRQVQINQLEIDTDEKWMKPSVNAKQNIIWSAPSSQFDLSVRGSANLQTAKTFVVDKKISGNSELEYDLGVFSGPGLIYLVKVKGYEKQAYVEQLIPLEAKGSVPLPNIDIRGLDIMVLGGDAALFSTAQMKRFEIIVAQNLSQQEVTKYKTIRVDANLNYDEIYQGYKLVKLPPEFLTEGDHLLEYRTNDDIALSIDPDYLKEIKEAQARSDAKVAVPPKGSKALSYISWLVVAMLIIYTIVKVVPVMLPPEVYPRLYSVVFWVVIAVLLAAAVAVVKKGGSDAFSWGGMILVATYGVAVHWKIRPVLASKWPYFAERHSAPYFMLFLALLILCAIVLVFDLNALAEKLAVVGYYLLISGVVIEFIQFSKESKDIKLKSRSEGTNSTDTRQRVRS